jgi:hypothetical protein
MHYWFQLKKCKLNRTALSTKIHLFLNIMLTLRQIKFSYNAVAFPV